MATLLVVGNMDQGREDIQGSRNIQLNLAERISQVESCLAAGATGIVKPAHRDNMSTVMLHLPAVVVSGAGCSCDRHCALPESSELQLVPTAANCH